MVLLSGVFATITPRFVASLILILSVPLPALPTIFNFFAASRNSSLIVVPLLMIIPS